jgi:hypothetical protein
MNIPLVLRCFVSGYPAPGANFGHIGHFGHVVALPKLQDFKLGENNKKRECIRGHSTGTEAAVPQVPVGRCRCISVGSEGPATAAAIRESCSVAHNLETQVYLKGDGLGPRAAMRVPAPDGLAGA